MFPSNAIADIVHDTQVDFGSIVELSARYNGDRNEWSITVNSEGCHQQFTIDHNGSISWVGPQFVPLRGEYTC